MAGLYVAATPTPVWLVLGPALIAGFIGLASALLSFLSARRALDRTREESRDNRAHQRNLLVWGRRLDAIENVWQNMFEVERADTLTADSRVELVRAVVWLPDEIGRTVLALVLAYDRAASAEAKSDALAGLREALLNSVQASDRVN